MAIDAKFTRTLPVPSATISGGFVFLLSAGWFTDADQGAAGSPINGVNSIANGGGDMQIFSDTSATTRLPIEVVTFVTGGSSDAQVWVRTPSYTSGDTITIGRDDTQTTQPAIGAAFGRNATWVDFELMVHGGTSVDSTGNHSPSISGSPSVGSIAFGDGFVLDGNTKYLQIPHNTSLNIGRNYSLDMWVDHGVSVPDGTAYADKVNSGNSNGFRMLTGGINQLRTRHPNLSSSNLDASNSNANAMRISSDMDGTTRINIKNGTSLSNDNPSGTVTNNTDDLYFGHSIAFPTDFLRGTLGDVWVSMASRNLDIKLSEYSNQNDPDNFGTSSEWVLVSTGVSIPVIMNANNLIGGH